MRKWLNVLVLSGLLVSGIADAGRTGKGALPATAGKAPSACVAGAACLPHLLQASAGGWLALHGTKGMRMAPLHTGLMVALLLWLLFVMERQAALGRCAQQVIRRQDRTVPAALPGRTVQGFEDRMLEHQARRQFMRIRLAWNRGDMREIRRLVTREMFVALRSGLAGWPPYADIQRMDVRLLRQYEGMISVQFAGVVHDRQSGMDAKVCEVWHVRRAWRGQHWLLAGILQIS